MYTIQTNASGTRCMEISEENLQTIEKYALFQHLIDSNGIVDESVLEKLKLNIRSLITSEEGNNKELLDLCIDVIYHNNMKAFGLHQLICSTSAGKKKRIRMMKKEAKKKNKKDLKEHKLTDWLPTTKKEVELRGWDDLDVILFSGDAYVDHPSFGPAVIGRLLEAQGLRVAIVPQPNWRDDLRDFKKLGRPRLFSVYLPDVWTAW